MSDLFESHVTILATGFVLTTLLFAIAWYSQGQRLLSLPPGPRGLPIVGSAFEIPQEYPWLKFSEWNTMFGDIVYVHLPLQPTIVLGSVQAAMDLLDKRSALYSSRQTLVMDGLTAWEFNFGIMPYSPRWRAHRKYFHEYFHLGAVKQYIPIQLQETRSFLRRALHSKVDVKQQIRHLFTASIVRIIYGRSVEDIYDEYVTTAQVAVEGFTLTHTPGAFWVEFFPFLRYAPSWVPGATFKKVASYYRTHVERMRDGPFEAVKRAMKTGVPLEGVAYDAISKAQERPGDSASSSVEEEVARNVLGVAYSGGISLHISTYRHVGIFTHTWTMPTAGTDTTTSAAQFFVAAMGVFPEVQRKAQAELDNVIGPSRLPDMDDYDSLPYIRSVALESMRWMPVVPFGLSHMVIADDEYKGHRIPKGSVIIPNAWKMLHDPEEYPSPEVFNPDRFLKDGKIDPSVRNPLTIAFGFGRRICPGRHLSSNSLFLFIASLLHVYNVEAILGKDGKPVEVKPTSGVISVPETVACKLVPRSEQARRLILDIDN
ncbi:hypothetical protein NLI96_g1432 [Meripilus lineatus]|uniref:Cytochrome P450 n=1 Tax=Meripilus lineatus TaxID=2056292 RepID=A0AAD5YHG2_9APHY|nr:hypothetical protein NLI96_g1432 [Physisporinus lineatus]